MFEKEAEERARALERCQTLDVYDDDESYARDLGWNEGEVAGYEEGFKDGAEFGYNKANEWHFVKDGDIPKDEDYKLCTTSNGNYYIARYEELFVHWSNQEYKEVCCPYAWKEIVLPKESE